MSLVISSPGLSPSGPKHAGFPNLSTHDSDKGRVREYTNQILVTELNAAGIRATLLPGDKSNSEVPGYVIGTLAFWSFERLWYYWSAKGPGLPVEVAERLHASHGSEVRVAGHCGCPSPRDWYKGFGVPDYHVDTPDGLLALADAIRSVYDPSKDPDSKPYCGGDIKDGLVQDFRVKEVRSRWSIVEQPRS